MKSKQINVPQNVIRSRYIYWSGLSV